MTYLRFAGISVCLCAGLVAATASGQTAPTPVPAPTAPVPAPTAPAPAPTAPAPAPTAPAPAAAAPAPAPTAPAPVAAAAPAAPATAPLDQTTPKALLRTFFLSRGEVDEATIRSLLHATGPVEQTILDAVVQVELAHGRLRAAEKEKFGQATATTPPPAVTSNGLEPGTPEEIDSLEETISGDRAVVSTPKVPGMSMQFVRVEGRWKLPIGSLVGAIDPSMAETLGAATRAQVQIIEALTAEVKDGKFTTQDQVRAELSRRFAERLAAATKSSTQQLPTSPATAPVSQPARGT